MAFSATTEWDVRTTGSDSNGGGFDTAAGGSAVDYSQQDSPQVTYTDLVIDGSVNTKITSAATPFTASHVGNIINITSGSGFTVQRVQVVSVASNVATCDKAVGTTGSTGGNGVLGGSLLTPITAINLMVQSNKCHIKAGTYTKTTNSTFNGTPSGPLSIIGYNSTHNDGGTKPLITTATNSIDGWRTALANGGTIYIRNISFSSTAATRGCGVKASSATKIVLLDCVFDGCLNAVNGDNFGAVSNYDVVTMVNCEIKNCTSHGIINNGHVQLHSTIIRGCTGSGVGIVAGTSDTKMLSLVDCVVASCAGGAIRGYSSGSASTSSGVPFLVNCAIYGHSADAIAGASARIVNSVIYGTTGVGITTSLLNSGLQIGVNYNNAFGSNSGGNYTNFPTGINEVTLTADPFTSSTVFTQNSTSGGGPLLKAAAYPGASVFGTGYPDIGPLRHQDPTAAGLLGRQPGMSGGCNG